MQSSEYMVHTKLVYHRDGRIGDYSTNIVNPEQKIETMRNNKKLKGKEMYVETI